MPKFLRLFLSLSLFLYVISLSFSLCLSFCNIWCCRIHSQYGRSCITAEASHGKRILLETPGSLISIPHQFAFMMIWEKLFERLLPAHRGDASGGARMLIAGKIVNNIYCHDIFITVIVPSKLLQQK